MSEKKFLGHATFLVLFLLAIYFYLERTIFVDSACFVYNLIYTQDFVISASRYAAVLPQGLPLLAIWLHLPLKVVLCLYSVSFIFLYYLIFLVITYWFKNDNLALTVPLVLIMGVQYSYFWIATETHQSVEYSILFAAFLFYSQKLNPGSLNNFIKIIIGMGLILLCFNSHPVGFFMLLFILGYFMIDQKLWRESFVYILFVFIAIMTITKVFILPNQYDAANINAFLLFREGITQVYTSKSISFLKEHFFTLYFFSTIIFIVTSIFYIVKNQYLKLSFYLVSIILFFLVTFITFPHGYYQFIEEKNFMPLNVFLLVPFMHEVVFSSKRMNIYKNLFLILIFLGSITNVINASNFFKERLSYINSLINVTKKYPEKKFRIKTNYVDRNKLWSPWAMAMESLLLSSLEDPDSSRSIFIDESIRPLEQHLILNDSLSFIMASWTLNDLRIFDKHYFNLDNYPYKILTAHDLYLENKTKIYENIFDEISTETTDSTETTVRDNHDDTVKSYYLLTTEFSPGFISKYSEVSNQENILLSASIKVCPLEEVDPERVGLIISNELGPDIFDYHWSYHFQHYTLSLQKWNTISVAGIVSNHFKDEILKVYLWNPDKKKIKIGDFIVYYSTE